MEFQSALVTGAICRDVDEFAADRGEVGEPVSRRPWVFGSFLSDRLDLLHSPPCLLNNDRRGAAYAAHEALQSRWTANDTRSARQRGAAAAGRGGEGPRRSVQPRVYPRRVATTRAYCG